MGSPDGTTDVYDAVYDSLLAMPARLVLARSSYGVDFARNVVANNIWEYRPPNHSEKYETIIVGEIRPAACGTRLSAKGNHYLGSIFNPTYIDDKTRVKSVFVLGKPSDCTEDFGDLWDNQIFTLREIVQKDKRDHAAKTANIKEWTARANPDDTGDPDYIMVVTEPMYAIDKGTPTTSHKKRKVLGERSGSAKASASKLPVTEDGDDMDLEFGEDYETEAPVSVTKGHADNKKVSTNDLYPPSVLPDYGGDLFRHVNAKLRQLDFRNIDDKLIPPKEWYSELRQGTLVLLRVTLHAYNYDFRRVYQLNAHTVQVLRRSNLDVEERQQTVLDPDAFNKKTMPSEAEALVSKVQLGKCRACE